MSKSRLNRRSFLKKGVGLSLITQLNIPIPFKEHFAPHWISRAEADEVKALLGKKLKVLNERPINAEALPHHLDDSITPDQYLFVRNNGLVPEWILQKKLNRDYRLVIRGEVEKPLRLRIEDLKKDFEVVERSLVLECGGNGRAGFFPRTPGNQWSYGAVGCPLWKGVRLRDVLNKAGIKKSAVYLAYIGHDEHLSGDDEKLPISRGAPIQKAMSEECLLAFEMNGKPISPLHGFPLRLLIPGYPASASGKWLKELWIRDQVHDGAKMQGYAYRMPKNPVAAGAEVPHSEMKIIEAMPVKSLITYPKSGSKVSLKPTEIRGHAWSGTGKISAVHVSLDFGRNWRSVDKLNQRNLFAWADWKVSLKLPAKGYYEIWARATDSDGVVQPMVVPGWNPKGYLNNAMPRIALYAGL